MATYVELLREDRDRIKEALLALVSDQERRIEELRATLVDHSRVLDQKVVRTLVFRNLFGPGQIETITAETETEDASKPVSEETLRLEREVQVLAAYREALTQLQNGATMDELGRLPAREEA